jgi:type I restriction enzyme R subunit
MRAKPQISAAPFPIGQHRRIESAARYRSRGGRRRAFGFDLRPYQQRAIEEVEKGLAADRRQMLLAMATGTGKTKLAIAMLYRLLAAKRFHRVCFVVDRSALGEQAEAEFRSTKVVSVKTFADIFGLKGLDDVAPDSETKVHICTIQGLVKRVLFTENDSDAPPIDQYDLKKRDAYIALRERD